MLNGKEVAAALEISIKTAEAHRNTIMHKPELNSFAELVHYAIRHQTIEP